MAGWNCEGYDGPPYGSYDYYGYKWEPTSHRQLPPPYERQPPPPPPRKNDFYPKEHARQYGRDSPPPPPPPPPPPRDSPSNQEFDYLPEWEGVPHPRNLQHRGNTRFRGPSRGEFRGRGLSRGASTRRDGSSPHGSFTRPSGRGGPFMKTFGSSRGGRGSPLRGRGSNRGRPNNREGVSSSEQKQGNPSKVCGTSTNNCSDSVTSTCSVGQSITTSAVNSTASNESSLQVTTTQPPTPFSYQSLAQANAKKKLSKDEKATEPGQANFISFKNSLQEYCQKRGLPVPSYTAFRNSFGYSSKVEVAGQTIQSSGIQREKKDAEQNAAYEALKALGLISATIQFTTKPAPVKRPGFFDDDTFSKKMKVDPCLNSSFKSTLNEFCQKFRLPVPSYETVKSGNGFVSTLIYNKKVYQSSNPQKNKKLAEQNAAQVVLHKLGQAPAPEPSLQDAIQKCAEICSQVNNANNSMSAKTGEKELNVAIGTSAAVNAEQPDPGEAAKLTLPASVQPTNSAQVINPTLPTVSPMQGGSVESLQSQMYPNAAQHSHLSYKNQLQEFCQKNKLELPQYHTVLDKKAFSCTVRVAGKRFETSGCKTKKGSEQTVARVALQSMGLLQPNQV